MFMRLAPLLTRSLRAAVSSDGSVCIIETNNHLLQVAALALLALLLVLEARCAHFVIAHFLLCVVE